MTSGPGPGGGSGVQQEEAPEGPPRPSTRALNTVVHAAFRRDLWRYDAALAEFLPGSQERADGLKRAWDFFDEELHHHHAYEEEFFWPALQQTDADLSAMAELDGEHGDMRAALVEARRRWNCSGRSRWPSGRRRPGGPSLTSATSSSGTSPTRSATWSRSRCTTRTRAPMKAALKQVKKTHFRSMGNFVLWLQDGASAEDRAGLRQEMSGPVIWVFGAVAGRRYRRDIAPVWGATPDVRVP